MDMSREPDESIELGSIVVETGENPVASVIWLHGLGADGGDFEPIVPQLLIPASLPIRFIFPDAPARQVTINGGMMMRAWYDIYEDIHEAAEQDETGIKGSAAMVKLLVQQQIDEGIKPENIALAGFSQGGAIALYSGLTLGFPLAGIMALSTYLPLADQFQNAASITHRPPVFMTHGEHDPVIPIRFAELSRDRLRQLDFQVEWNSYKMEHNVCAEEIMAIREWLIEVLGR